MENENFVVNAKSINFLVIKVLDPEGKESKIIGIFEYSVESLEYPEFCLFPENGDVCKQSLKSYSMV